MAMAEAALLSQEAPSSSPGPGLPSTGHQGTETTADYLASWLLHTRTRVRPTTYEGYERLLRLHAVPRLGAIPLSGLRPLHLQSAYSDLLGEGRLGTGTVLNLHLALTQALGQALRWGLIPSNPAQGAQPPRARRAEPVVVDAALATRLLVLTRGTSFELPVALGLSTGMRRGEVLGLRWPDIDADLTEARVRRTVQPTSGGLVLQEPKTRRSARAVALPAIIRPYLVRQREDQARRRAMATGWRDLGVVVDRGDGEHLHPGMRQAR